MVVFLMILHLYMLQCSSRVCICVCVVEDEPSVNLTFAPCSIRVLAKLVSPFSHTLTRAGQGLCWSTTVLASTTPPCNSCLETEQMGGASSHHVYVIVATVTQSWKRNAIFMVYVV